MFVSLKNGKNVDMHQNLIPNFPGQFRLQTSFFPPRIWDIVESLLLFHKSAHIYTSICGFVVSMRVDIYDYILTLADHQGAFWAITISELSPCTHTRPNRFCCFFLFFFYFRGQPQQSKEISYLAAIIWLRSSPNSTAPGPRPQTGRSSTSTSQTSKAEQSRWFLFFLASSWVTLDALRLVRQVPGPV